MTLLAHYISLCKCDLARPYSDRAVEIAETIRSAKPGPKTNVQKMLAAYRAGDLEALEEMTNDPEAWGSQADAKQNMELMLFKRNEDWIPKLEVMFASKSAFVAVGAAHLIGERGLIHLLRAKGYTVERIAAGE